MVVLSAFGSDALFPSSDKAVYSFSHVGLFARSQRKLRTPLTVPTLCLQAH